MLSKIISLVFDKAVDEPNFGEMYATLCVDVSKKSGEWSVVRTGRDLDKAGKFFWTDDIMVEKEIVGPFTSREECIAAATAEAEPAAQARTQKLRLSELVISGDKFIKILESMEGPHQYFTVFRALSEGEGEEGGAAAGEEKLRDRIHGGFEDEQSAMEDGHRATTFKKLLLKKCQEEFYKVRACLRGWG
jgi:translation initiation factor 4G